jgi:hypothetical protein
VRSSWIEIGRWYRYICHLFSQFAKLEALENEVVGAVVPDGFGRPASFGEGMAVSHSGDLTFKDLNVWGETELGEALRGRSSILLICLGMQLV